MFNLLRLCRKDEISFDFVAETGNIVAKNGNNVKATFDIVEIIVSTCSIRQCCLDIVAGVDGATNRCSEAMTQLGRRKTLNQYPTSSLPSSAHIHGRLHFR